MDSKQIALALLPHITSPEFNVVWKMYVNDLIKQRQDTLDSYAFGDNRVYAELAKINMLKELVRLPERVKDNAKGNLIKGTIGAPAQGGVNSNG